MTNDRVYSQRKQISTKFSEFNWFVFLLVAKQSAKRIVQHFYITISSVLDLFFFDKPSCSYSARERLKLWKNIFGNTTVNNKERIIL